MMENIIKRCGGLGDCNLQEKGRSSPSQAEEVFQQVKTAVMSCQILNHPDASIWNLIELEQFYQRLVNENWISTYFSWKQFGKV